MVKSFMILGLTVLLAGRTARSMTIVDSSHVTPTSLTVPEDPKKKDVDSTDLAIRDVLNEIKNRIFHNDDSRLVELIKRGIIEAARSKPSKSIEAGAKKAQLYVTNVTAAYTQAIFRANTAQEAQEVLLRFQDTVQRIVDYAKNGEFASPR